VVNQLLENGQFVGDLRGALRDAMSLDEVPVILKRILTENRWQSFTIPQTRETVNYTRFEEFAKTKPLEGLGASIATIKRMVRDDPEALDLLDRAMQQPHGGNRKVNNVNLDDKPEGNSANRALRKLRDGAPELHARVLAGELSPHAAMVEAGFRRRSISVPDDPTRAAAVILRHFQGPRLKALITALSRTP
jgi:hypothetical protein